MGFGTGSAVRIRIQRLPGDSDFEGFDLRRFEIGAVYDVGIRLAELLILAGFATMEMRLSDRGVQGTEPFKA